VTHCVHQDIEEMSKTKGYELETERDNCQIKTHAQNLS